MWKAEGPTFWMAVAGAVIGSLAMLVVLHFSGNQVKRTVTIAATFLAGLFYFLEFFIPPHPVTEEVALWSFNFTKVSQTIGNATQVIAGFTFLLGIYNLCRLHGNAIRRLREGWINSVAFYISFLAMTIFAFWRDWNVFFGPPSTTEIAKGVGIPLWVRDTTPANIALPHDVYTLLFEGFYRNLEATMFSILAFYIVSAAYRAFRVRSGEAAVLMIVALVLMMGQVPLGMAVTNWIPQDHALAIFRIETFSQYVLTAINSPAQRAIQFGLGLGTLAMALRIWLSLERGTYFEGEG
jgi:hypothetical protein